MNVNYNSLISQGFKGTQNIIWRKIHGLANVVHNIELQIGDYRWSAHTDDFSGWMLCDGRSLLISDYPQLFKIIGTSFGSIDSDHFNLPNFSGRVIGAIGTTGNSGDDNHGLGDAVGSENITLTIPQMPSHVHTGTTDSAGVHNHDITDNGHTHSYINEATTANPAVSLTTTSVAGNSPVSETTGVSTTGITINNNGAHVHTFTSNSTGGGQSHSNIQPTLYAGNMFIFAKYLGYI